eukprot:gnl/TRDRNA2_/TRDRNA2_172193_c4_seq3.p2 gnl/TRDRNA2_/TRDRNA2_172193_c4~~gnl/TRDRNA2_/TRDRNA2_172193_c4_seq3.p2  ORF type:complete len:140 (-),score=25.63 gnl/TRDRNA2_/TRDRNA2_172193_c4_seq3:261-680(-)
MIFATSTKHLSAMRLAQRCERPAMPHSLASRVQARNATFACISCAGSFRGPPLQLGRSLGADMMSLTGDLYSKELSVLLHVLATAHAGNPASVCKAVEDFGLEASDVSRLFLKVAAGTKAEVLKAALHRDTSRATCPED